MSRDAQPPAPPPPATAPVAAAAPAAETPAQKRRRWLSIGVFAAVAFAGVLAVLYAWQLPPFATALQRTENATVRGQVTLIGTQLNGFVAEVLVQDFQPVKQGQVLVRLDDRIYRQRVDQARAQVASQQASLANFAQQRSSAQASVAQAQATLANAQAQAARAEADLRRVEALAADGSLSQRELDATRAARVQARAAVEQARAGLAAARTNVTSVGVNRGALEAAVAGAQAALRLAEIDLGNTELRAPSDGQLGAVTVRVGAYVSAGSQLTSLVPPQRWVVANLKETQMAHVRPGQPVTFTVDALEHAPLRGHVERSSPATGSEFSVIAPDNATGNFVKIAQRIPVRIAIEADQPLAAQLKPGMSVVVSIDTGAGERAASAGTQTTAASAPAGSAPAAQGAR
ncbi:HlyD family secretion protein [Azohydromonas lata]|uniref:HlyD family secretion protein n=1 Tax=Azohydromonas lata TaxID=45677 RepID=A0ABU5IHV7_9BURK|nr:HlyD family secretion protein [Azohydromonas lata]MDZ5458729.1 HlyD family secretion protein [Azohydromonas lata]